MGKRIRFTINGVAYSAALADHPLAGKIASLCPFEAEYRRSGNHEYYAILPEKVSPDDCVSTTKGKKNGIYLFEGWNALSLVIQDYNTAPYPIYHIGNFDNDVSAALEKAGGHIRILCETE